MATSVQIKEGGGGGKRKTVIDQMIILRRYALDRAVSSFILKDGRVLSRRILVENRVEQKRGGRGRSS